MRVGAKDESNHLVAGSLRSFPQDSRSLCFQLCQVKLTIGGLSVNKREPTLEIVIDSNLDGLYIESLSTSNGV